MREEHTIRTSGLGRPLGLFRSGQTFVADSLTNASFWRKVGEFLDQHRNHQNSTRCG